MKKFLPIVLSAVIMITCMVTAYAAKTTVYGDELTVNAGQEITVPICIKNNTGIMGFRITVNYDNSVFGSPSVENGNILSSGNLNDSISDKNNNSFDVVWNNAENIYDDGIIFYVKLKVDENAKPGKYTIRLSYSQQDTFNEKWEDVDLNCSDITVVLNGTNEDIPTQENWFDVILNKLIYFWKLIISLFA